MMEFSSALYAAAGKIIYCIAMLPAVCVQRQVCLQLTAGVIFFEQNTYVLTRYTYLPDVLRIVKHQLANGAIFPVQVIGGLYKIRVPILFGKGGVAGLTERINRFEVNVYVFGYT